MSSHKDTQVVLERSMWWEIEASCQNLALTGQPCEWVTLEAEPTALVKGADNYSPDFLTATSYGNSSQNQPDKLL